MKNNNILLILNLVDRHMVLRFLCTGIGMCQTAESGRQINSEYCHTVFWCVDVSPKEALVL